MLKHSVKSIFTSTADRLVWFSRTFGRLAWLVFLLVFSLIMVVMMPTASSSQTTFNDIQGNWAQACIEQLGQQKIITGYSDGSFKPDAPVLKAEFAEMLDNAFANAPVVRSGGNFADIPLTYWAEPAIRHAYQTGFLSGDTNSAFNPEQPIPRWQVLVSLANGLQYTPTGSVTDTLNQAFSDAAEIPDDAQKALAAAAEKQLVVNYPNIKTLNPNQPATRAEVGAFLCQALKISKAVPSNYVVTANTAPTQSTELRGVWMTNIDSNVIFDRDRLARSLERLKQLNFNTVYPSVWNWGYTLYPSNVARKVIGRSLYPATGLEGRDFLQEIIKQGHQQGIAVIPWFEFGFMAPADADVLTKDNSDLSLPKNSDLAQRQPDWLTSRRDGTKVWKEGIHDRVWLNPFHPEVQQFIQSLILEIVSNYDVDGIQFDDHFGLPYEFGYDSFTVALYKSEHGGQSPPDDPQNADWIRWRADKITAFMKQVFQAVKQRKPKVLISVAPNPLEFSYNNSLADWLSWERQGLAEELIIQVYRDDINGFIAELERPEVQEARSHIPVAIGIMAGVKDSPVAIQKINEQVKAVRQHGFAGEALFFYESLWNLGKETPDERRLALKELFPVIAERPNIVNGWKPSS